MKLLFICTHNRCRSILAEAIANKLGGDKLTARSAGSQPAGEVHPLSLKFLAAAGIDTNQLKSESWDEYENWNPDVVITVCDSAAGEACPVWFGHSLRVHWGLADPSAIEGTEDEVADAFRQTIEILSRRINTLLASETDSLTGEQLLSLFNELAAI